MHHSPRRLTYPPAHHVPELITRWLLYVSLIISVLIISLIALLLFPTRAHAESLVPAGMDIIFLVDDSKSVWDTTDPADWRTALLELTLDTLASDIYAGEARVSVITFGTTARRVHDFTPLRDSTDVAVVKAAYRHVHEPRGWSDLYAGLQLAYETMRDGHRDGRTAALVLLSDGWLDTPDGNETAADYIAKVETAGAQFAALSYPVALYPVMVNRTAELYPNAELWRKLAEQSGGSYFPALTGAADLSPILWELWRGLTAQPPPAMVNLTAPATHEFAMPAHAHTAIFHLVKSDPQMRVQLVPPQGAAMQTSEVLGNSGGHGEIWTVKRSEVAAWQGNWQVQITGAGRAWLVVTLLNDEYALTIEPSSPAVHPACKPLDITVELRDAAGTPVSPTSAVNVTITSPNGTEVEFLRSVAIDDTCAEGDYHVTAHTAIADAQLSTALTIPVALLPWLRVTRPGAAAQYPRSETVPLLATIMLGDQPDPATAQLAQVTAQVAGVSYTLRLSSTLGSSLASSGSSLASSGSSLASSGKAVFAGEIPASVLPEGEHRATFILHSGLPHVPDDVTHVPLFISPAVAATEIGFLQETRSLSQPTGTPVPVANEQMGKSANGQMGKSANEQMGKSANEQMGKWANGQIGVGVGVGLGMLAVLIFFTYRAVGRSQSALDGLCLEGGLGSSIALKGRHAQTVEVSDAYGEVIARLQIRPIQLGAEHTAQFTVRMLDGTLKHIRVGPYTYAEGDTFIPRIGDEIEVGEHTFEWRSL